MAEANMDVGFEKYIIFHRAIESFYINSDSQLVAVYQDGTEHIMGDPLGDEGREKVAKVITADNNLQSNIGEINAKISMAQSLLTDLTATRNETVSAKDVAVEAKENAQTYAEEIRNSNATIAENVATLTENVTTLQNNIVYLDSDTPPADAVEGMIWLKPKHTV